MIKKIIWLPIVVAVVLFTTQAMTSGSSNGSRVTVGYCPTMAIYTSTIDTKYYNLVELESSSEVMRALNDGMIDIVIIGRKAQSYEKGSDTQEVIVKSGYTLVGNTQKYVQDEELATMTIHTSSTPEAVYTIFSSEQNIIYYESTELALQEGAKDAVLIEWDEYRDGYDIITPMKGNQKNLSFRSPVIYHHSQRIADVQMLADKLKEAV